MSYAQGTVVPVEKSMAQVRTLLIKNGCTAIANAETAEAYALKFAYDGIPYRFMIRFPLATEQKVVFDRGNRKRTPKQIENYIENERKRLWRALLLYLTAAIEAHNNNLIDLRQSFMANILTKDGTTLYERAAGDLARIVDNPKFLLN